MSTKIGVAIRIRPFLQQEINLAMQGTKLEILPHEKEIRVPSEDQRGYKSFKFDKVLQEETTQDQMFAKTQIQDLVNKVVEGYHSTIFAYGQTGSGKTYTMEGYKYELDPNGTELNAMINPNSRDAGIIPRAVKGLFNTIKSNSKHYNRTYTVYCSYLQIYNEKIFDLLNPAQLINANSNKTNAGLRLRWTAKDQFTVENLFIFECKSAEEVLGLFHQGIKNKMMASHKLNLTSSRSHCILSLRVESVDSKTSEGLISSKLDLVDLAGSERTSMTGNESQMAQKESIEINKSLFTLRQVISTLSDAQKFTSDKKKDKMHAPFRDSKLTSLLKQSIGGNSFCLMIACLSPADRYFEENLSTLTYATKAAYISNEPHKNEDPKTRLISTLKVQVGSLAKELDRANVHISFLSQLTNEKIKGFPIEPLSNDKNETNGFRNTLAKTAANHKNSTQTTLFNHTRFAKRDINSQQTPSRQRRDQSFDETPVNKNKQHQHQHTNYSSSSQDRGAAARFHSEDLKSPEMLQEKLTESINTVKDLLRTNKELRTNMDKHRDENETLQGELYHLHKENQDLRERLAVFESLFNCFPVKNFL